MCGIVFTNNLNIVNNIKKKILAHTSYRGPDLNKFIIKNQLFFGFNYLSIINKVLIMSLKFINISKNFLNLTKIKQ